ncbi:MAG: type II toxin-antitoxin system VapC family toxin [Nitrososphaerales archaeon]
MPNHIRLVLDTTFLVLHYFSSQDQTREKTTQVLRRCALQGNRALVPTVVLAEFYAQAAKRAGRDEAKRRFEEVVSSNVDLANLDVTTSQEAGHLRQRYKEKIPWGDCIIAATSIIHNANYVVSEDPHFETIEEIKTWKLEQIAL